MRRWRRGGRRKRKTNWIPGANFGEAVQSAATIFTALGTSTTTGFSADLTNAADLASSGGEGAVVCRVIGELQFHTLVRAITQLPGWIRVALFTRQLSQAGATVNSGAPDLFSLQGLSQENILWTGQVYVLTEAAEIAANEGFFNTAVGGRMSIDAGSRRRLEEDLALCVTFQGQQTSGGVGAPTGVSLSGYLRVLLQHAL